MRSFAAYAGSGSISQTGVHTSIGSSGAIMTKNTVSSGSVLGNA